MDKVTPEAAETCQDMDMDIKGEKKDMTNLQDEPADLVGNGSEADNLSVDDNPETDNSDIPDDDGGRAAKYAALNDSYLRLMADFDNFRKRTVREKADLIKSGSEAAMTALLPVVDDFERALNNLNQAEDMAAVVEGVKLIYGKFTGYLSQQGVNAMEAVGQPFDADLFEAIATIPATEGDKKGKIIDCVQTGYTLYDKVIRHAKVVVGE